MKNEQTELFSKRFSRGTLISAKAAFILFLVFLISIPLMFVYAAISERQNRNTNAITEISEAWSHAQRLTGPVLVIPYLVPGVDKKDKTQTIFKTTLWLPELLEIKAKVDPEVRYRGMFEAVVYKSDIDINGTFSLPSDLEIDQLNLSENAEILWDSAKLVVGITDMRRLKGGLALNWNGQLLAFSPGSGLSDLIQSGIQASSLNLKSLSKGSKIPFTLKLHLDGSESINFLPLGMNTLVFLYSAWPHPSFIGAFLPEQRHITKEGFEAAWEISHFGRAYSQNFTSDQLTDSMKTMIENSHFGVRFLQPVDTYRQSERAVKYGSLFIIFTFMVYFLFELITGIRIHIFQYALAGIALCIFFLLLIALAEHIGFGWAYSLGAALVIAQVSLYSLNVVKTLKRTLVVTAVLTALYVYLYIVLRLEDYALLIGALALFLALGIVMFVVRNVDWFSEEPLQLGEKK